MYNQKGNIVFISSFSRFLSPRTRVEMPWHQEEMYTENATSLSVGVLITSSALRPGQEGPLPLALHLVNHFWGSFFLFPVSSSSLPSV